MSVERVERKDGTSRLRPRTFERSGRGCPQAAGWPCARRGAACTRNRRGDPRSAAGPLAATSPDVAGLRERARAGFLEHDAKLEALEHPIDAAVEGSGGVVMVERPAGIGRSALLGAVVITVLVVDDEALVRAGFRMVLDAQPDIRNGASTALALPTLPPRHEQRTNPAPVRHVALPGLED